jgi:hypothetical protein
VVLLSRRGGGVVVGFFRILKKIIVGEGYCCNIRFVVLFLGIQVSVDNGSPLLFLVSTVLFFTL